MYARRQIMAIFTLVFSTLAANIGVMVTAQDYQDYQDYADGYAQQDNLYSDYAVRQQDKNVGGNKGGGGG